MDPAVVDALRDATRRHEAAEEELEKARLALRHLEERLGTAPSGPTGGLLGLLQRVSGQAEAAAQERARLEEAGEEAHARVLRARAAFEEAQRALGVAEAAEAAELAKREARIEAVLADPADPLHAALTRAELEHRSAAEAVEVLESAVERTRAALLRSRSLELRPPTPEEQAELVALAALLRLLGGRGLARIGPQDPVLLALEGANPRRDDLFGVVQGLMAAHGSQIAARDVARTRRAELIDGAPAVEPVTPGLECPRCGGGLLSRHLGRAPYDSCADCGGVLVAQRSMVPLLDALAVELAGHLDPDADIEAMPDVEGDVHCPLCTEPMTTFGYLGTQLVLIDRCGGCGLVWTDPDELGAMCRLYARTQRRMDRTHAWHAERRKDFAHICRATLGHHT